MSIANNLNNQVVGFDTDTNLVTFTSNKEVRKLSLMNKEKVRDELINEI